MMQVQKPEGHTVRGPAGWHVALPATLCLAVLLLGCSSGETRRQDQGMGVLSADIVSNEVTGTDSAVAQRAALRFVTAPSGNVARYRVREQLVRVNPPNDAVGSTASVSGVIAFDSSGAVMPAASRFTIDVSGLASDRERRDGYVRNRTLETSRYPTVVLRPTAVRGLTWPLPTAGSDTFELVGDLTIKGVTRPTTWTVQGHFDNGNAIGTASTAFTFADFQLAQPRVPVVLSVADTIRLEYDFQLAPGER